MSEVKFVMALCFPWKNLNFTLARHTSPQHRLIRIGGESLAEAILLGTALIRILVVDDYGPWHGFISATLRKEPELQIIGHVSDGLEAVQHAERLQPDLILMDIGLPTLNGIEAASRIREVSPTSKILFVSQNRSPEIVRETLSNGAGGYVVKSHAGSELLPAIKAILEDKRFISATLTAHVLVATTFSTTMQTIVSSVITSILGVR